MLGLRNSFKNETVTSFFCDINCEAYMAMMKQYKKFHRNTCSVLFMCIHTQFLSFWKVDPLLKNFGHFTSSFTYVTREENRWRCIRTNNTFLSKLYKQNVCCSHVIYMNSTIFNNVKIYA